MRGKDDRVRAFFNTCPHRGAMVCREKQRQRQDVPLLLSRVGVRPAGQARQSSRHRALRGGFERRRRAQPRAGAAARSVSRPVLRQLRPQRGRSRDVSRRRDGVPRSGDGSIRGRHGDRRRHAGVRLRGELETAVREQHRRLSRHADARDVLRLRDGVRRPTRREPDDGEQAERSRQRSHGHRIRRAVGTARRETGEGVGRERRRRYRGDPRATRRSVSARRARNASRIRTATC